MTKISEIEGLRQHLRLQKAAIFILTLLFFSCASVTTWLLFNESPSCIQEAVGGEIRVKNSNVSYQCSLGLCWFPIHYIIPKSHSRMFMGNLNIDQ